MSRLKHTVYAEALLQQHSALFRPYLAMVGLSEEVLERPDAKIPLSQYNALLEVASKQGDPFLGLRLGLGMFGEPFKGSLMGGVGHLARSAADVRTMLECASRFIVVHAQANDLTWRLHGGCL